MSVRQDKIQLTVEIDAKESAQYGKLLQNNRQSIRDFKNLKAGTKEYEDAIQLAAKASRDFANIDLTKLTQNQLIERSRQIGQMRKNMSQATFTASGLEREMKELNDELARGRARTRGVSDGLNDMRIAGMRLNPVLQGIAGGIAAIGVAGAVRAGINYIRSATEVYADFERQITTLGVVSQGTEEDLKRLRDQALDIGGSTNKSASDVAALQIELARLGRTTQEIIDMTPDIVFAAIRNDIEDVGAVAKVTGGLLNAFSLDVSETGRVTNVMSAALSGSAMDFEWFSRATTIASPIAKQFGASIESVTAYLSAMADQNVDASTAATGLRNILIELSASGMTLDDAFNEISNSTNKVSTAVDLFDKRAGSMATILAENNVKVEDFTRSLENLDEALTREGAQAFSEDVKGQFEQLASASERLKIEVAASLSGLIDGVVVGMRQAVAAITTVVIALRSVPQFIRENQNSIKGLIIALVAFNWAAVSAAASTLANAAALKVATIAKLAFGSATGKATLGVRAFSAAMMANPLGLVIGLLALLIFNFDKIVNLLKSNTGALGELSKEMDYFAAIVRGLANGIAALGGVIIKSLGESLAWLAGAWLTRVKEVFKGFEMIWNAKNFQDVINGVFQIYVGDQAVEYGRKIGNSIIEGFKGAWDEFIEGDWRALNDRMERITGRAVNFMTAGLVDGIRNIGKEVSKELDEFNRELERKARGHMIENHEREQQMRNAAAEKARIEKQKANDKATAEELAAEKARAKKLAEQEAEAAKARREAAEKELQRRRDALRNALERENLINENHFITGQINESEYNRRQIYARKAMYEQLLQELAAFGKQETNEFLKITNDLEKITQEIKGREAAVDVIPTIDTRNFAGMDGLLGAREQGFEIPISFQLQEDMSEELVADRFKRLLQITSDYQMTDLELQLGWLDEKLRLMEENGQKETFAYMEMQRERNRIAKEATEERIEIEQSYNDAVAEMEAIGRAEFQKTSDALINFLGRDEEARKKNWGLIQALKIAQVKTNYFEELSGIWKNANSHPLNAFIPGAGNALAAVQTVAATSRMVMGVSEIQGASYAEGGEVGKKKGSIQMMVDSGTNQWHHPQGDTGAGYNYRDETGYRVAGVVHEKEYVVPKWMNENPRIQPIINYLEGVRTRRLKLMAVGGMAMPGTIPASMPVPSFSQGSSSQDFTEMTATMERMQRQMERSMQIQEAMLAELRKPVRSYVVGDDIRANQAEYDFIQNRAKLTGNGK